MISPRESVQNKPHSGVPPLLDRGINPANTSQFQARNVFMNRLVPALSYAPSVRL